jgi:xylan 1,4-beta-xylosidase
VPVPTKIRIFFSLSTLLLCSAICGAQDSPTGLRSLHVDAGKTIGQLRDFQGLNGTPNPVMAGLPNLTKQYKELHVNQVRTHDSMGPTEVDAHYDLNDPVLAWLVPDNKQRAELVKSGNAAIIFQDWNADPEKPESYHWGPSDVEMTAIHDVGAEIYYRIGRSFGSAIQPPSDPDKFANVIKHVAMHYNQGWDHGFHYNIRYWEFWNEPEAIFWGGTPEQFYTIYDKTARALKSVDPNLKVGGVAKAIAYDDGPYREGFIDYCAKNLVPLDFYSWHTYADTSADPYDGARLAEVMRKLLDSHGFPKAESILSEWNLTPDFTDIGVQRLRSEEDAAFMTAELSYFQDTTISYAHFYRGDAAWMGLFDLQGKPYKTANAFKAMGELVTGTPNRLAVTGTDTYGFSTLAGRSTDGKTIQILIGNYARQTPYKPTPMQVPPEVLKTFPSNIDFSKWKFLPLREDIVYKDNAGYNLTIDNLPWGKKKFHVKRYRITKTQNFELVDEKDATGASLNLTANLPPDAVEFIVLQAK